MPETTPHDATWERMIRAVEKVRRRLTRATAALDAAGVSYAVVGGHAAPAPDTAESEPTAAFRVINLDAIVRMKLTSFRLKDRVHPLDMIEVGLIDTARPERFPPPLADRLRQLLENPEA